MKRWSIIVILIIAAFLRLYAITSVPPSPSLDEVSLGYNAYSLLSTGRDEYGTAFPLLLRAYDDWRPALYAYLVIPFIKLAGLTPLAVRLPALLLSLLSVYAVLNIGILLGKKYFNSDWLGIIAAGVLAISPWHIYLSRLGHEVNLGLTLFVFATYCFLVAVERAKPWLLIGSGVLFGLTLHGYQSEKIVTPLFAALCTALYWKQLTKVRYQSMLALVIFALIATPAVIVTFSQGGLTRLSGTSAFSPDAPVFVAARQKYVAARAKDDLVGEFLNHRVIVSAEDVIRNYFSHFEPRWLFWGRERESHKAPGMGLLYFWEAPLIAIGLYVLWKRKIPQSLVWILVGLILISPIPAAITNQAPHAMRSYTLLPAFVLIESIGAIVIFDLVDKEGKVMLQLAAGAAVFIGLSVFWQSYFVIFPVEQSDSFQYAMGDAVQFVLKKESAYDRVIFATDNNLAQSYMFFLFYSRYDPARYQQEGGTRSGSYAATHRFGKYEFREISSDEHLDGKTLLLVDSNHVPPIGRGINTFVNKDGKAAIAALSF